MNWNKILKIKEMIEMIEMMEMKEMKDKSKDKKNSSKLNTNKDLINIINFQVINKKKNKKDNHRIDLIRKIMKKRAQNLIKCYLILSKEEAISKLIP
jgi:hypothetical protein